MSGMKNKVEDTFYEGYISMYQPWDEVKESIEDALVSAKKQGSKETYVSFESTLEPYEDYSPGPVLFSVMGYRDMTRQEIESKKELERKHRRAKDLGITCHEVTQLELLEYKGVIKKSTP